jgi:amino acid permease
MTILVFFLYLLKKPVFSPDFLLSPIIFSLQPSTNREVKKVKMKMLIGGAIGAAAVYAIYKAAEGFYGQASRPMAAEGQIHFAPHHRGRGFHQNVIEFTPAVHPHSWMQAGSFMAVILQLLLIAAGFLLWKTAQNGGLKKWAGIFLAGLGLFLLLPKIVFIPMALIGLYTIYKIRSNEEPAAFSYDWTSPGFQGNRDFLDEWEKKTKMEE